MVLGLEDGASDEGGGAWGSAVSEGGGSTVVVVAGVVVAVAFVGLSSDSASNHSLGISAIRPAGGVGRATFAATGAGSGGTPDG